MRPPHFFISVSLRFWRSPRLWVLKLHFRRFTDTLEFQQFSKFYEAFLSTLSLSSHCQYPQVSQVTPFCQIGSLRRSERKWPAWSHRAGCDKVGTSSASLTLYSLQQWSSALATHWNYWRVFLKTLFRLHTQRFGLDWSKVGLRHWDFSKASWETFSNLLYLFIFLLFLLKWL